MEVLPEELLIALNVLTMPPDQFNQLKMNNKVPKPRLGVTEATLLATAVQQTLGDYTTTLEEDKDLLSSISNIQESTDSTASARRLKMALQVRIGEKQILSQVLTALGDFDAHQGQVFDNSKRSAEIVTPSGEKRRKL